MAGKVNVEPAVPISHRGGISGWEQFEIETTESGVTRAGAYAVKKLASNERSGVSGASQYTVLSNPASVSGSKANLVHRNDNAVIKHAGYIVFKPFYVPYWDLTVEYPFTESRFPESISYGSSGGPGFKTSIFSVDSGLSVATAEWDRIRARYTVKFDRVSNDDIEAVQEFFYGMRGRATGFRFKDWNDYKIINQNVVIGDGATSRFQLFKRYRSGTNTFDRVIKKPVRGTVSSLYLDGVELVLNRDFHVNYNNGEIILETPPENGAVGRLDYSEFDVPVRFDTDSLTISAEDFNQYSIDSLELIEVLS